MGDAIYGLSSYSSVNLSGANVGARSALGVSCVALVWRANDSRDVPMEKSLRSKLWSLALSGVVVTVPPRATPRRGGACCFGIDKLSIFARRSAEGAGDGFIAPPSAPATRRERQDETGKRLRT